MNQPNNKTYLLMLLCISINLVLQAQDFNLIDINTSRDANPTNYQQFVGNRFAVLNHLAYFAADDGIHGSELWFSDGALGGTKLVKDINPGTGSSNVQGIITSGKRIYFSANDNVHGQEIWVSDGTRDGTKMLKDIYNGAASSTPEFLTDVNGIVYFIVSENYPTGTQLWKTDGTREGTKLVANFYTSRFMYGNFAGNLINFNGHLFFSLFSATYGTELWTSDGTRESTHMVADINPNGAYAGSYPSSLTPLDRSLYFSADDGTGRQLWVSDGTASGTHKINNSKGFSLLYDPLTTKNRQLYFPASNGTLGNELCKYDPSDPDNEIELVKDINAGADSSNPYNITNVNGTLFFATNSENGPQLWKSDGTKAGTVLVKDISPGNTNYFYINLVDAHGTLLFTFYTTEFDGELWRSDGTADGTKLVKNIFHGKYSSSPMYFTDIGNDIIFSANDGIHGIELWRTNSTPGGTTLVKDINRTTTAPAYPNQLTPVKGNKIIFSAGDSRHGSELWKSDGTVAGTQMIKDIIPGSGGFYPYFLTEFRNETYFINYSNYLAPRLWKTDGTAAGTHALPVIFHFENEFLQMMIATDNLLYVLTYDFINSQNKLWRSDGTTAGTYLIKTFGGFYGTALHSIGKILFFSAYDDTHGLELWKSDGTVAGTKLVKDIFPGADPSWPQNFITYKGKLYFAAEDISYNFHVWTSDGTETGTKVVNETVNAGGTFTLVADKLFFYGFSYELGNELCVTDGTNKGTRLVRDIYPGWEGSYYSPNQYSSAILAAGADSLFYFVANDGSRGYELWKSDGTPAGTRLVKDITPGIEGSNLYWLKNVAGRLYFLKEDVLWTSDGTAGGTMVVNDPTLDGVSQIWELTALGNKLYFTGYSYAAGNELYAGSASTSFAPVQAIANNISVSPKLNDPFEAKLLTNPVIDQLRFTVNLKNQQAAQIIIADASGRTLLSDRQMLSPGTHMFSYNASSWLQGTYMIKIITADGSSSLKAIK